MLLDYDSASLFENTGLMAACISSRTDYYVKALVLAGYNSDCPEVLKMLEAVISYISYYLPLDNLNILFDNGFDKYSRQCVVFCINNNNVDLLKNLINRGESIYALLDDIWYFITTNMQSKSSIRPKIIQFVLDNIYQIESMSEPVTKYLLLTEKNILPPEINIFIMKFYMELDYFKTNEIRTILEKYKPEPRLSAKISRLLS